MLFYVYSDCMVLESIKFESLSENQEVMRIVKLLDSYILGQQLHFTFIFAALLLGVSFSTYEMSEMIHTIAESGMPVNTAICAVAMHLPEGAVVCLPAAVLISTLFVFHRMCNDSEIVALLTTGISFNRILSVVLATGAIVSIASFLISEYTVPLATRTSWKLFVAGIYGSNLPSAGTIRYRSQAGDVGTARVITRFMFAGKYLQKYLSNVTVLVASQNAIVSVINASTGTWEKGHWVLTNGRVYNLEHHSGQGFTTFARMAIPGTRELDQLLRQTVDNPDEFDTADLKTYIDSHGGCNAAPSLLVSFYQRYSRPFACFFIALAGAPLGLSGRRSRTWLGLAYGGIILTLYYALLSATTGLAEMDAWHHGLQPGFPISPLPA